jgi:hypothetical protein
MASLVSRNVRPVGPETDLAGQIYLSGYRAYAPVGRFPVR